MRTDVAFACEQLGVSERRACKLIALDRSSYRYEPRSKRGFKSSAQRVYRLYRAEGLVVRRLKRKRLARAAVASHLV